MIGDTNKALEDYESAIELSNECSSAISLKASLLRKIKYVDDAREKFKRERINHTNKYNL